MRSKYKHTHIYISNSNLALCSESITQNKYHDDDHALSSVPSFRIGNYLKDDINIFTYEGIFCHRNGYAWHKSFNSVLRIGYQGDWHENHFHDEHIYSCANGDKHIG